MRAALQKIGIMLKIVEVKPGGDIDQEVFTWLDFAETIMVFGCSRYGQDTGNPACTYNELKFAKATGKRIILLRLIPNGEPFLFPLAQDIFSAKDDDDWLEALEWIWPDPMPERLPYDIADALMVDVPQKEEEQPTVGVAVEMTTTEKGTNGHRVENRIGYGRGGGVVGCTL